MKDKKSLKALIENDVHAKVAELYPEAGALPEPEETKPGFEGDFSIVVFPLVKIAKKKPEEIAEEIGEALLDTVWLERYSVAKGFLNFTLKNNIYLDTLMDDSPSVTEQKDSVMVEYSSPNTNKPLHLGHIRNNLLGNSLSKILEADGHPVIKTQVINDRGIHICKSMWAWEKFGNGETPETSDLKGDKLVGKYYVKFDQENKAGIQEGIQKGLSEEEAKKSAAPTLAAQEMLRKWEEKDPNVLELWSKMNGWVYEGFASTYLRLGVSFDEVQYESETYLLGKDIIQKGLEQGVFYQRPDGSVWIDLTEDGLDEKLVLRSDGTSVYMTQDIGTAVQRFEKFPISSLIYTVGNEQDYHFQVLFLILKKLGYSWSDKLYHLSYGMVELPEGKMKSREGTVVDADDLMEEMYRTAKEITEELGKLEGLTTDQKEDTYEKIGLAALKYYMLKVDPQKKMLFDPKKSIDFQGNTGPFILYTRARIQSLLAKAGTIGSFDPKEITLEAEEKKLIRMLDDIPNIIHKSAMNHSPAVIANYTYELVKTFNTFYQLYPIMKAEEPQKNFRLYISEKTGTAITYLMGLLGIDVVERM